MTLHMPHPLAPLLSRLTDLFADEDRPGGTETAQALAALTALPPAPTGTGQPAVADITSLVADSPHGDLAPLMPQLAWRYSGLEDGRIRPEIASHMLTSELVGPTGMIYHDRIRAGLFYQGPNLNYVTRVHSAEETFVVLAGTAEWTVDNGPLISKAPGDMAHHPSMAPHRSVTRAQGTLAAWRWTGDIRMETYDLIG